VKVLLKTNIFYLLINVLNTSVAFLLVPFYVSNFSVSVYGTLSLMNASLAFIAIFITLNLGTAVQTFYFDYNDEPDKLSQYVKNIFSISLLTALSFSILLMIAGPSIFQLVFKDSNISFYPNGMVVLFNAAVVSVNHVYYVVLRNQEQLKSYGYLILISVLVNIGSQIVGILVLDLGILGALLGPLLANSIVFIFICLRSHLITFQIQWEVVQKSLVYAFWLLPYLFIQWFLAKGDRLIIEHIGGLDELGIYALLINVSMIISIVATSMLTSIRPMLFKEFKLLNGKINKGLTRLFMYYLFGISITAMGIYWAGHHLEIFGITGKYLLITKFLQTTVVLFIIKGLIRFFNEYLTYLKKSKALSLFSIINAFILLFALFYFKNELSIKRLLDILIAINGVMLAAVSFCCLYFVTKNNNGVSD